MSNHPTIAALRARLESERKELAKKGQGRGVIAELSIERFEKGHEAATERLMAIIEKMMEVIELASDKDGYFDAKNHKVYDIIRKARELLASLEEGS